jgi:hypothetical protein
MLEPVGADTVNILWPATLSVSRKKSSIDFEERGKKGDADLSLLL